MGVRHLVQGRPSGPAEWLPAAQARLDDAAALIQEGRFTGALYLLGYVAEMRLKAAVWAMLRLPDDRLWQDLAGQARHVASRRTGDVRAEAGHSLRYWALVLIAKLRDEGGERGLELGREIANRVGRLHADWTVDLRYSAIAVAEDDCRRAHRDVVRLGLRLDELGRS